MRRRLRPATTSDTITYTNMYQRCLGLWCHPSACTARPPIDTGPGAIYRERVHEINPLPHYFTSPSPAHVKSLTSWSLGRRVSAETNPSLKNPDDVQIRDGIWVEGRDGDVRVPFLDFTRHRALLSRFGVWRKMDTFLANQKRAIQAC